MAIISPLPYTIVNGQAVDATPVMADMNQIVNNVNANAAALAGSPPQVFSVANATTSSEAVPLGQAQADFAALNGSSSQVFNVAAAGTSTEATQLAQTVGAGGSSYTDFTASRAFSTTYTNNTGRPLVVCISMEMGSVPAGGTANLYASVSGTVLAGENSFTNGSSGTKNWNMGLMFIVPPTATYIVDANPSGGTATLDNWYEY